MSYEDVKNSLMLLRLGQQFCTTNKDRSHYYRYIKFSKIHNVDIVECKKTSRDGVVAHLFLPLTVVELLLESETLKEE